MYMTATKKRNTTDATQMIVQFDMNPFIFTPVWLLRAPILMQRTWFGGCLFSTGKYNQNTM